MAQFIPNTYTITIDDTDYTANAAFPLSWNELLDEQLDEMTVSLVQVATPIFKPYRLAVITITGREDGTAESAENTITKRFYTMDDKADEIPSGSGKYNHDLYLIEETKITEKIVVRSIGYKNTLLRTDIPSLNVIPGKTYETNASGVPQDMLNPQSLTSPIAVGDSITLYAPTAFLDSILIGTQQTPNYAVVQYANVPNIGSNNYTHIIIDNQGERTEYSYRNRPLTDQITLTPRAGLLNIEYTIIIRNLIGGSNAWWRYKYQYTFAVIAQSDSVLQPWNAYTVLKRALVVAEPLRQGETPRFSIEGDNPSANILGKYENSTNIRNAQDGDYFYNTTSKTWYKKTSANVWTEQSGNNAPLSGTALYLFLNDTPEFNFTQSTFREILQNIGSYVHGEPRLTDGVISYDRYGGNTISPLNYPNYASKSLQINGDRYVNNLDSTVGNLVNSIGYSRGTITEPYDNGLKTVRTETLYARIDEANGINVETTYGIRSVSSLKIGLVGGNYNTATWYDITGFVFEINEYQRLSSYSGAYPTSKAYALYYTQGQHNVDGFLFKAESTAGAVIPTLNRYTMLNILNAVTGNNYNSLASVFDSTTNYAALAFQITYEPFVSARVQQSKMLIDPSDGQALTMVFNADQNIVESHYFGEKLKGQIAKLGNVDKTLTYVFNGLPRLPRVGDIWQESADSGDDYYISALAVEVNPYNTKFTMALSQNFNKYSDYVGINSTKRYAEVSESQAYDSQVVYKDYVIIGDTPANTANDTLITDYYAIKAIFDKTQAGYKPITAVKAKGQDKDGNDLATVLLPVYGVAMGNSAVFTFNYADNFSAGNTATWIESGGISGYFQNGAGYTDYFGNMEYLNLDYYTYITPPDDLAEQTAIGTALPYIADELQTLIEDPQSAEPKISTGSAPLWVSKGSTEKLSVNYQIDFVSNRADVVIGSGLAKTLPFLVGDLGTAQNAVIYRLAGRPYKFAQVADLTGAEKVNSAVQVGMYLNSADNAPKMSILLRKDNGATLDNGYYYAIVNDKTGDFLLSFKKIAGVNALSVTLKHKIYN